MTTRRSFLKALGLVLGAVGLGKTAFTQRLGVVEAEGATTFVAAMPEGVQMLRENMRIDFLDASPQWLSAMSGNAMRFPKMTRAKRKAARA